MTVARIFVFPGRRRMQACTGCGSPFAPQHVRHKLCDTCFAWSRILHHSRAACRAFDDINRGRR